jgi:hypothetical protein
MTSIFTDKNYTPTDLDLKSALSNCYPYWHEIDLYVKKAFQDANANWHYSGDKFGWSFRISDKKRVIIYLLPRAGFFKTAFVFGEKATQAVLKSEVADDIKAELYAAKVYAEGRGIRLSVRSVSQLTDVKILINIKLTY